MKSRKLILTTYECKLLKLCSDGKTHQEIADELYYSKWTIDRQIRSINLKLEVNSQIDAVTKAHYLGLI
jgi:LuxR family transcriptional regulator, maltose regulon positive regulatory protein